MPDDKRYKDFVDAFDQAVNAYLSNQEIVDLALKVCHTHRTLQQSKMRLVVAMLREWAAMDKNGWHDLRNEATVKLATKLLAGVKEDDLVLPMI